MTRPKAQYIFPSLAKRFLYILFTFCCNYLKIFATHGVSIESIELFSVACAQEKHYVLGKRPNNFCSSRKYSLANTLLKQKRNKEEQQQQRQTRVVLHHVLGKRPNKICSSRNYSSANTAVHKKKKKRS